MIGVLSYQEKSMPTTIDIPSGSHAFDNFKNGTTEFSGTASAVAVNAGASADADYEGGVAIFTAGESGLMLQASIGGQGFSFESKE